MNKSTNSTTSPKGFPDLNIMEFRHMPAADANGITPSLLKAKPFFNRGTQDDDLFTDVTLGANSIDYARRSRLLAEVFPALTLPAGGNKTIVTSGYVINNTDMQVDFQRTGIWPKERDKDISWRHSDAREVAYPFVLRLFENMADVIEKGVAR